MSTVRVELRVYDNKTEPKLVRTECFECDDNGCSDEAGKRAWSLSREHDGVEYVVVEGDQEEITDTWGATSVKAEDSGSWRLEIAREEGMLHGVDAYNEVMGWD